MPSKRRQERERRQKWHSEKQNPPSGPVTSSCSPNPSGPLQDQHGKQDGDGQKSQLPQTPSENLARTNISNANELAKKPMSPDRTSPRMPESVASSTSLLSVEGDKIVVGSKKRGRKPGTQKSGRPPGSGSAKTEKVPDALLSAQTPRTSRLKSETDSPFPKKERAFEFDGTAHSAPVIVTHGKKSIACEAIDFALLDCLHFAQEKNMNAVICRKAGMRLYELDACDDVSVSGQRIIEMFWNDLSAWLSGSYIYAFLCYLATKSEKKVVVVDSWMTDPEKFHIKFSERALRNACFNNNSSVKPDVVLFPLFFPDHWALLIHDEERGTFFADSLAKQARRLDPSYQNFHPERIPRVEKVLAYLLDHSGSVNLLITSIEPNMVSQQDDGCSCGYYVCLFAEAWLFNDCNLVLDPVDVNAEKKRILWHINELYSTDNVPYHSRCPILEISTLDDEEMLNSDIESLSLSHIDKIMDTDEEFVVSDEKKQKKLGGRPNRNKKGAGRKFSDITPKTPYVTNNTKADEPCSSASLSTTPVSHSTKQSIVDKQQEVDKPCSTASLNIAAITETTQSNKQSIGDAPWRADGWLYTLPDIALTYGIAGVSNTSIAAVTKPTKDMILEHMAKPRSWLDDGSLYAFLCILARQSPDRVVVISPLYTSELQRFQVKPKLSESPDLCYNYDENWQIALFPILHQQAQHLTLLIHRKREMETVFYDSLPSQDRGKRGEPEIDNAIHGICDLDPGAQSHDISILRPCQIASQQDGWSCGYHVCLIAEQVLSNEHNRSMIDINDEKRRILWHVGQLLTTDDVQYIPRQDKTQDIKLVITESLGRTAVPGDNQPDENRIIVNTSIPQDPIVKVKNDDDIFIKPKLPARRSKRIAESMSRSPSPALNISKSRSPSPAVTSSQRRSSRIADRKSDDKKTPTGALGPAVPFYKRCDAAHKGRHCAAASARHYPDFFHSGQLGDKKCPYCTAYLFVHESSNLCCRTGCVALPQLSPHPKELEALIVSGDEQSPEGKEFVQHEAKYNNLVQFASVTAGSQPSPAGGPMAVILNGDFNRRISSMRAGTQQIPGFSQLYILDPEEAREHRINNPVFTGEKISSEGAFVQGHALQETTLDLVCNIINKYHPAAEAYMHARAQLQELLDQQKPHDELKFFRLTLKSDRQMPSAFRDQKLHPHQVINPSTGKEMFAIHADPEGEPAPRGIWIQNKEGILNELAPYSPWTDSLTYPLIFPKGDDGYHLRIPYAKLPSKRNDPEQESDLDTDDDQSVDNDDSQSMVSDTDSLVSDSDSLPVSDDGSDHGGKKRKYVSLRDHTKYRLAIRPENDGTYHHILSCGGGLGQKWILDQAAKIDYQEASFLRKPEMDLRVSTSKALLDYLANQYNKNNQNAQITRDDIGSIIRYKETKLDSLQYWKTMYEDCNAVFARNHNPKKARFMITFTNNTKWIENQEHLYNNGQVLTDRFDIWMRVWKSKVLELHRDLYEKDFFGKITCYGESMEFQGRGGPHVHIVCQTDLEALPSVISDYIWAHIPNEPDKDDDTDIANMYRDIRKLIELQLHRCDDSWCGPRDLYFDRCKKGFPAPYSNITILHPDRPAVYYRPSPTTGGATLQVGNIIYDNSHVVPYNPVLLIKYQAHHNVLYGYGNKANIKYALKYPFKGTGYAYIECKEVSGKVNVDEPAQYAKMKFRTATEAWAVVTSQPFANVSHTVHRLNVHLPGEQKTVFRAFQAEQKAKQIQMGKIPESKCSAYWLQWRAVWKNDPKYKELLFEKVPEHFRWVGKQWVAYKRKPVKRPPIGRIYPVMPVEQERFALYMLMKHFAGDPEHLLQKGSSKQTGVKATSFVEAATNLGLMKDDHMWKKTLEEASISQMPNQMRLLFVSILVFGNPNNGLALWNEFKIHMYKDHATLTTAQRQAEEVKALTDIDWRLFNFGRTCTDFSLPEPPNPISKNADAALQNYFFGDDDTILAPPQPNQPQSNTPPPFNADQQKVFDEVLQAIRAHPSNQAVQRLFFVTGDGGTGKTFLLSQMIRTLRKQPYNCKVLATASTGCASILLPFGRTAHSTFRLGWHVSLSNLPSLPLEGFFARRIREAQLVIIDEITMLDNTIIEIINRVCKQLAIRQLRDYHFGGKVIVFSGCFRQTLPVVPGASLIEQVMACFQKSPLWQCFKKTRLMINQRMGPGQQEYLDMCRQIGTGANGDDFWIPKHFLVNNSQELVDFIYPDFKKLINNDAELKRRLILAPHNETCDFINEQMLNQIPGQVTEYFSTDYPLDERPLDIDEIESEVTALNMRTDSGMPPHRLRLKVGCVVVLLINMSDKDGLVNGTRFIIEELGEHRIVGRVLTGVAAGRNVKFFLQRARNVYEDKHPGGIKYERLQFPIKLAFAMTILKGQGQTVPILGINLEREVFSHGQLNTAFTRATDGANVRVFAPNREIDDAGAAKVSNIVACQFLDLN